MADDTKQKNAETSKANQAQGTPADLRRTTAESPGAKAERKPAKVEAKAEQKPAETDEKKAEKSAEKQAEAKPKEAAEQAIEKAADAALAEGDDKKHLAVVPEAQLTRPPTGNVVAQAWLVLLLAAGFGSGLAALERAVGPTIAQNKLNETLEQVPSLVPGATRGEADDATIPGRRVFRALDDEGRLVGWVVNGKGQGFADKVELIIGVDAKAETLTGIFVLDQKETPALGDNITREDFRSRFVGVPTDATLDAQKGVETNKQTGVIQALTGATISSDAVCTIINQTIRSMKAELAAAAGPVAMGGDQ